MVELEPTQVVKWIDLRLWWHDPEGRSGRLEIWYALEVGWKQRQTIPMNWREVPPDVQRLLRTVIDWGMARVPRPPSYHMFGREHSHPLSLDNLAMRISGREGGAPPLLLQPTIGDPGKPGNDPQQTKSWSEHELEENIREVRGILTQRIWRWVLEDLTSKHDLTAEDARGHMPRLTYLVYRSSTLGRDVAERLYGYLSDRGLAVWRDVNRASWGESLDDAMQQGLEDASAAVIVNTPDLSKSGTVAQRELQWIRERLSRDPEFRAGVMLVGLGFSQAETLPRNPVASPRIEDASDPAFSDAAETILRGILGLPQQRDPGVRAGD